MQPPPQVAAEVEILAGFLQRKIREAGLTYSAVERQLGMGKDTLRHLLSGRVDLKVKHVFAILEVLKITPMEFFGAIYLRLTSKQALSLFESHERLDPPSPVRLQLLGFGLLARKLTDKGFLSEDEAEQLVEELERSAGW